MSKIPKGPNFEKPPSKNIKNIYVQKIHSLMKISRDNIHDQEVEMLENKIG